MPAAPHSPPSSAATPLALLAALGLLATGVYGAGFWLSHDPGPSAEQVALAAQALRSQHQPGDLIILQPAYATRAREYLGDLHPVAVQDPLQEDFDAHPRVWVFGLFDKAEAIRPRMKASGLQLLHSSAPAPGITMDLWSTGTQAEPSYDFLAQLATAKVWHEKGSERIPCDKWTTKNGQGGKLGRWACPYDKDWFYVAPEWHRMGDHLRLCLWAHPPNDGRLVIQFANVPLRGRIFGHAGHTLNASLNARAPIDLDVSVGKSPSQRLIIDLADTWRPFSLSTATTTTATVTFAVSSSDAGVNHFCFAADVREAYGVQP